MMVVSSEKFANVRGKLDFLGYKEHLGEESLLLVERLLSDLILATHSLRECKREFPSPQKSDLENQLENLKEENLSLKSDCAVLYKNISELQERFNSQFQITST